MPWPGPEGSGLYGSVQNVFVLGTPGSASLTKLELDLGRSAEIRWVMAWWELWKGKLHRRDGARVEEGLPGADRNSPQALSREASERCLIKSESVSIQGGVGWE